MRLSADSGDPGYETWLSLYLAGNVPRVFLDGVEEVDVVTVDDEPGLIVRAVKNANGNIAWDDNEMLTEEVRGDVLIIWS